MRDSGVNIVTLPDSDVEMIRNACIEWLTVDFASLAPECEEAADICVEAMKTFGSID